MAINKKLISFATQAQFDVKLNAGDIDNRSIVFIEDKKRIWTHGVYFDTSWDYVGNTPNTIEGYNIIDAASKINSLYYVVGNTSGTAGAWTGTVPEVTSLYAGLTIAYKIGVAGASTTNLNLNGLGNKRVRRNTSNLTTHLPVGTVVLLTYDGTYWVWADYHANTTYAAMSVAEGTAGTVSTLRTMRADYLKQIIEHYIANTAPSEHTLGSHSDVTITSNSNGEILRWNGTNWVNNTLVEAGIASTGQLNNYLPLSGGTMSGSINYTNASGTNPMLVMNRASGGGAALVRLNITGYDKGLGLSNQGDLIFGDWSSVGTLSTSWNKVWHSGDFTSTNISNWNTSYDRSLTSLVASNTSSGLLTLNRQNTSNLTTTLYSLNVRDVRSSSQMPGTDGSSSYMPLPSDTSLNTGMTALFSSGHGNSGYKGVLTIKGWTGSYSAWQLAGTAQTSTSRQGDFFLRAGSGDTWDSWKRIWHSEDFSQTNINNWNTAYNYSQVGHLPLTGGTVTNTLKSSGQFIFESNLTGSFREGARFNLATSGWAGMVIGGARGTVSGNDNAWWVARNTNSDFVITYNTSSGNGGLELPNSGNNIKWRNQLIYHAGNLTPTNYALKTTKITAGTGLTGSGTLANDTTLAVNFGTTATTVAKGDHGHSQYQTNNSVYYRTANKLPTGNRGWYKLFSMSDNNGVSPVICMVSAYAHSSMIFTATKGYSSATNVNILNYNSSLNNSYAFCDGVRVLNNGEVQIRLNKPSSLSNFYVRVHVISSGNNVKPNSTLILDEVSASSDVKQELFGTTGSITSNLVGNASTATALTTSAGSATTPIYFSGGKPVASTSTVGGTTTPIYLKAGVITPLNHTLATSVPSGAKFTDENVKYTLAADNQEYRMLMSEYYSTVPTTLGVKYTDNIRINPYASSITATSFLGKATSAGNADTANGQKFNWSNSSNSPTYLWAANTNGTAFLASRANISVNYATSAGSITGFTSGWSNSGEHNANNISSNGMWYYTSNGPTTAQGSSTNDGALYSQAYSTTWVAQIAQDYRNGRMFVRGKNNGTWKPWLNILDSGNSSVSGNTITINGVSTTWVNTHRGIQNNLTSTSTVDSLSAAQGRLLANGSARDSTKVALSGNVSINIAGANFVVKNIPQTSTGSHLDKVILLIPICETNTSWENRIEGEIIIGKNGGNIYSTINISAQSNWNSTIAWFESTYSSDRLVTVMYGGVKWLAYHPHYTANPYVFMYFKGFYSEHSSGGGNGLTTIIFYNHNTNTVVNSEINSSITKYTPTRNPKYRNGYAVWNASNLTSLDQVSKINAGSVTQPVYFSGGKPVATTYSLGASVPSNAVFTDTNTFVTQSTSTTASYRPILLGQNSITSSTSNFSNVTNQSYYSNALRMQPSTGNVISKGSITASSFIGNASSASKVNNNLTLKFDSGTTENTNLYTFNGSAAKTIDIKAGSNVTLTKAANTITISSTNTNTTYSTLSVADGKAGTATAARTVRADYLKQIIQHYDTNSLTGIRAGASQTNANSAVSSNPYIKVIDDSTYRSQIRLMGGGATTVKSDASGNVTISSTNTVYTHPTSAGNKHIPSGGSTNQILRWSSNGTAVWSNENTGSSYTHPTGDGNLHVPKTGTTNNGKVLKAGATAGSISWGTLGYADVGAASSGHTHSNMVKTSGTQTIGGAKTFSSAVTMSSNLTVSGNITATGDITAARFFQSSDIRLKNIIKPLKINVNDILNIPSFYFKYKGKNEINIGTSAQEVQKVFPALVDKDSKGILSVEYDKFGLIALELIKTQQKEIDSLKYELNNLKLKINGNRN